MDRLERFRHGPSGGLKGGGKPKRKKMLDSDEEEFRSDESSLLQTEGESDQEQSQGQSLLK